MIGGVGINLTNYFEIYLFRNNMMLGTMNTFDLKF